MLASLTPCLRQSSETGVSLVLLQNADDLFVHETITLHSLVLPMGQSLPQNGLFQRGKVTLSDIQPGKPQQNTYVERYNRTVPHEWLDQYIIESTEKAQEFATQWL